MITFTDKERQLAQYLIDVTDGSNSVIFENPKKLGWDVETARGVFASLVKNNYHLRITILDHHLIKPSFN